MKDLIGMLRALDCEYRDKLAENKKRNQGKFCGGCLVLEPVLERKGEGKEVALEVEAEEAWAGRCSCTSHLA